jgi:hypothetical protein
MEEALDVLKGFENKKLSHIRSRNMVKWLKKGHVTNKEFCALFKYQGPRGSCFDFKIRN